MVPMYYKNCKIETTHSGHTTPLFVVVQNSNLPFMWSGLFAKYFLPCYDKPAVFSSIQNTKAAINAYLKEAAK